MDVFRNYDRGRALAYAKRWARGRNPLFYNFTGIGGDCTNFVSQCVLAGCCAENFTPDFGWYYRSPEDRAPAFTGVRRVRSPANSGSRRSSHAVVSRM